jgi:hypothetical protein
MRKLTLYAFLALFLVWVPFGLVLTPLVYLGFAFWALCVADPEEHEEHGHH